MALLRRNEILEELTLYVPNLKQQFDKREELQHNITLLSSSVLNTNYIKEERKLYLSSVQFGTLAFQIVLLDFEQNRVTFKRKKDLPGDLYEGLSELLTSLKLDFKPIQLSFVMHRPIKQN